jgi:hypothetical protein
LFVVVAVVVGVVLVNRQAMLSRDGAATAVLIDEDQPATISRPGPGDAPRIDP